MSMMLLGAIDGFTEAKADHKNPYNQRQPLNSSNWWSLHSSAVSGAALLMNDRRI
jgi:hypothetical protein